MGEERLIKDPWTTGGNGPVMPDPGHEILKKIVPIGQQPTTKVVGMR